MDNLWIVWKTLSNAKALQCFMPLKLWITLWILWKFQDGTGVRLMFGRFV